MIIKPDPQIPFGVIKALLEPTFMLTKDSENIYSLELNGSGYKVCPECTRPHKYLLATCELCSAKLELETRWTHEPT